RRRDGRARDLHRLEWEEERIGIRHVERRGRRLLIDHPPLRLGNYEPLLELASGGMASVYVARRMGAAGFEHIVVLKRVHRHLLNNREFYDMFRDEARVASLVRHPNVVPVVDVVESEGERFL